MYLHKVVEKIKPRILCSITFSGNPAVYDRVEKCGRDRGTTDENTIGRMRIACWITKTTKTRS